MRAGDIITDTAPAEYAVIDYDHGRVVEQVEGHEIDAYLASHVELMTDACNLDEEWSDCATDAIAYRLIPIRRAALVVLEVRPDDLPKDEDERYDVWPYDDHVDYTADLRIIDARPDWLRAAMDEAATREGDAVAAALLRVVGEVVPCEP